MADVLHHPQLGQIRGKQKNGVTQFLGLKYAILRDRFSEPELVQGGNKNEVVDATRYGYCPLKEQPP